MSETIGSFIALAWLVVLVLLVVLCLIIGLASIFLKDSARRVAVDILLAAATLLLAFGAGGSLAVGSMTTKMESATDASEERELVREADYYGYDLTNAEYVDRLDPFWNSVARSGGGMSRRQALKAVEADLRKTFEKHPDSAQLAARLAIVVHAAGGDYGKVFAAAKNKDRSKLLDNLRPVLTDGKHEGAAKVLAEELPDGWYRRTALKLTGAAAPAGSVDQFARGASAWASRFVPYTIISYGLALVGLAGIFVVFKRQSGDNSLPDFGLRFRQAYGICLAVVYVELLIALVSGWTWDLFGTAPIMDPNSAVMRSTIVVAVGSACGLATAATMVYFLICRPQGISFARFWNSSNPDQQSFLTRHYILLSLIGFCIALLMETLVATVRWFVGAQPFMNDATNWELVLALHSGNAVLISLGVLAAVVIAPINEELLVRGLIYRWLRGKWGVRVGVVLSSLLFAAMHLDFQGFWEYFTAGVVLALMYERTKNLTVSAMVHALWNAWACFTSTFLFPG